MTTIAYKDGELSADTMTTERSRPYGYARKIGRVLVNGQPRLFAAAGDTAIAQRFRAWCLTGMEGPPPAMSQDGREAEGYVFYPDHSFECYEKSLPPSRLSVHHATTRFGGGSRVWAGGSGAAVALGALFSGVTARVAIEVAIALDSYTGGQVDCEWFDESIL